jgi:hypothetical protein
MAAKDEAPEVVAASAPEQQPADDKKSVAEVERVLSHDDDDEKNPNKVGHADYDKIDKELAAYAGDERIYISPEENDRLRRMIDRRVLTIMIATYFLQAIDKGTMSFSSIMGLPEDTGMTDAEGNVTQQFSWLTSCIYIVVLVVEYPQVRIFLLTHPPHICTGTTY